MRFEVAPGRNVCFVLMKSDCFILLEVRLVSKALKGEIVRFLLFFCFVVKQFQKRAVRGDMPAQGVQ